MWNGIVFGFSLALGVWLFSIALRSVRKIGIKVLFQWAVLALILCGAGIYLLDTYFEHEAHASAVRNDEASREFRSQRAYDNYGTKISCREHPDCATSPTCLVVNSVTDDCRLSGY